MFTLWIDSTTVGIFADDIIKCTYHGAPCGSLYVTLLKGVVRYYPVNEMSERPFTW